jgi:Leucine-rich repeat (LRR) protein
MESIITFNAANNTITNIDPSFTGDVVISRVIGGIVVKTIGSKACNKGNLRSLDASSSEIETIQNEAFVYCHNLTLPDSVKFLGGNSFAVTGITKFVVPKNTHEFTGYVLNQVPNLKELSVAEGNEYFASKNNCIFNKDFSILIKVANNVKLSDISNFYALVQINSFAFTLSIITDFISGPNVTYICSYAFHAWPKVVRVDLSLSKIRKLPIYLFDGATNLESVVLPKELELICANSLSPLPKLKELIIPHNVSIIESSGIGGLKNLKRIYVLCDYKSSFEMPEILSNYYNTRNNVIIHVHETYEGDSFGGFTVKKDLVLALQERMKPPVIRTLHNNCRRNANGFHIFLFVSLLSSYV